MSFDSSQNRKVQKSLPQNDLPNSDTILDVKAFHGQSLSKIKEEKKTKTNSPLMTSVTSSLIKEEKKPPQSKRK